MSIERRHLLRGAVAAVGGATLAGSGAEAPRNEPAAEPAAEAAGRSLSFHGSRQPGILTPAQAQASFVSFDLTVADRGELADLMHTLTERARFLSTGGTPPNLGISAPPSDSGIVGPQIAADGLSLTVGLGASVFGRRFGLAGQKPKRLRRMDTFTNDDLDPARTDGDLLIQFCAANRDTVLHALRDLTRHTRGGMQARWRLDGFCGPPRPAGAARNLLGFKDGTANPVVTDVAEMDRLIWVGATAGEPAWAVGGTYQVVRVIRMLVEFWDRVSISEQERMIGRRRDSGAPLSGSAETDVPAYADDPTGATVPLDAHIRVANPRTADTDSSRILRRGYNYDGGIDGNGNLEMGLIFTCFQQDLDRQFVAIQKRLADEPLVDYVSPVGGGYFFALPGVRDASDWYARALLS
jgi:deferrochelatase/peroxidase EfeB